VLTYLILFRLKELGYNNFKAFVDTQPTRKIYKLLEFIFNEERLAPDGCLKRIWKDFLDEAYIDVGITSINIYYKKILLLKNYY